MATIWITYAWADNESRDVDFIAQELESVGLSVKLDRWNISAGGRLWEQIEEFITSPDQNDAWVLIATQNSLSSEPCKEEFSYALGRALESRGGSYPVIGLFLGPVDRDLIPAGIRNRLYLSVTDPDWKGRLTAAAEGRSQQVARPRLEPFELTVHKRDHVERPYAVEVRPRAGTWSPFFAAVPRNEQDAVQMRIVHGPRGRLTTQGVLMNAGEGETQDWYIRFAGNEATPTQSYYVSFAKLPTKLAFGVNGGSPQFTVSLA